MDRRLLAAIAFVAVAVFAVVLVRRGGGGDDAPLPAGYYRIDYVVDGDTVALRGDIPHVRLLQIDTPEVYGTEECFGKNASAETKKLLPKGTVIRLEQDPATDATDMYGRLLRYVIRASDNLNVNVFLVQQGFAAPYFFDDVRGKYATEIDTDAQQAKVKGEGLWAACPQTPYDPTHGVDTGPPP